MMLASSDTIDATTADHLNEDSSTGKFSEEAKPRQRLPKIISLQGIYIYWLFQLKFFLPALALLSHGIILLA